VRVVALAGDLMDRSRLGAACPDTQFVNDVEGTAAADVVVVDLARHGDRVRAIRAGNTTARIIGYGPHVDGDAADRARSDGADVVLARSRFFRDPAAVISGAV
jgi:hypothetical protein